jgi:glycosyltransferase involved in cell wall biosynthesis
MSYGESSGQAPLRVVHVASGREWRGGQRQVLLLAKGLAAIPGVYTSVVTGTGTILAERLTAAGITLHGVTWSMGLDPRVVATLLGELTPGTIVHAHDSHAHTLADAAIRLRKAHMIVTRRVDFPIRQASRWQRVERAIALSTPVRDRLLTVGVPRDRITIVPPAVDLEMLDPLPPWPAAVPMRQPGAQFVVCVAALTPEKGIDVLLEAAARLHATHPHVRWLVLGDGPQHDAIVAKRRSLDLDQVVELAGHIEHPEAVVALAQVLVQPSRSEGSVPPCSMHSPSASRWLPVTPGGCRNRSPPAAGSWYRQVILGRWLGVSCRSSMIRDCTSASPAMGGLPPKVSTSPRW